MLNQTLQVMSNSCPCGSGDLYASCCEVAHKDITSVTSSEALMRSRYSAFVKANVYYLMQSWSSKTRDNSKRFFKELLSWTKSVQWVRLEVESTSLGKSNDVSGTVAFKAFYFEKGVLECITENSYFEKENGHWVYIGVVE